MKTIRENKKSKTALSVAALIGDERGVVLAITLMIMGIMAVTGAAIISTSTTDVKVAGNVTRSMQALNTAEAGMSNAINFIRANPDWAPDADKDGTITQAEATQWATDTNGTVNMGKVNGAYAMQVYASNPNPAKLYGRADNSARTDKYTDLKTNDVLVEVTGNVNGVARKVGLVIRNDVTAFTKAVYSNGTIEGNGIGANPGKFTGEIFAGTNINLQGNFNLGAAQASAGGTITPDCATGVFQSCTASAAAVVPPKLDFAYYQNQANFTNQQVFMMTPTVGSTTGCGANCTQWPINYAINTMGTSYTVQATVQAQDMGGGNYKHTVNWCTDPNWNGVVAGGSCAAGGGTLNAYTFTADEVQSSKPFMNAYQFNSYSNPTGAGYTSSVVNVIDAQKHLEFLGPADPVNPNATVDITASILVGTAANNTQPAGKIDFEGGTGTMNFKPANGLAVVAQKVEFKAKYSSIKVNVGTATAGAVIIATKEMEVEAKNGGANTATFNMNGSLLVGNNTTVPGELDIGGDGNTSANFTYTAPSQPVQGLKYNNVTITLQRREWRELD